GPTGGVLTPLAARLWPQAPDPCKFEPRSFCHYPLPKTAELLSKSPSSSRQRLDKARHWHSAVCGRGQAACLRRLPVQRSYSPTSRQSPCKEHVLWTTHPG